MPDSVSLNEASHGYVFLPVLLHIKKKGVFDYIKRYSPCSFKKMCNELELNSGVMRVVLHSLSGMGYFKINGDLIASLNLDDLVDELSLFPESILNLYAIDPLSYLREAGKPMFSPFFQKGSKSVLGRFFTGSYFIPLFVSLYQHNKGELDQNYHISLSGVSSAVKTELIQLFNDFELGELHENGIYLTEFGAWAYKHALNYALCLSYRPLLSKFEMVISEDYSSLFQLESNEAEKHVDRALNVLSSGSMHKGYFKSVSKPFEKIFNQPNLGAQPSYIIDTGCGDGTFLSELYDYIKQNTVRGKNLEQAPLTMVGVDYNRAALEESYKRLSKLKIPHLLIHGDIGNPSQILKDLAENGIDISKRLLHVRSFLDHDRPYISPNNVEQCESSSGVYIDNQGETIPSNKVLYSLQEHLERWKNILKSNDDLMILEVHGLKPTLAFEARGQSISFHFDLLQALSGQMLVSAKEFYTIAAKSGLASQELIAFPHKSELSRITFNHFRRSEKPIILDKTPFDKCQDFNETIETKTQSRDSLFIFIKKELEKLTPCTISLETSLLSLGLDSLDLGRLARKLNSICQKKISLPTLFKRPKVRELIEHINGEKEASLELSKPIPLALSQEPMWLWFELIGDTSAYNVPRIEHFKGKFSLIALKKAILNVVSRQTVLRTKYSSLDGTPVQELIPLSTYTVPLRVIDLRTHSAQNDAVSKEIEDEVNRPFNLFDGETFRILCIRLSDVEHILIITMHHMVTDGSSVPIFWHEFVTSYNASIRNRTASLQDLPIQYFDWALSQRKDFESGAMVEALDFWRENLKGELPVLELPVDYPYPKTQTYNGSRFRFSFSQNETKKLHDLCKENHCSLFMVIVAAWGAFLCRHSEQEEIIIGTPWANRDEDETQNLIGCFVNTLPLRLKWNSGANFTDLIQLAKDVSLNAFENAALPFHKVVVQLDIRGVPGRLPVYQTMVALEEENGWIRGDIFEGTSRDEESVFTKIIRDTSKFEISLSIREKYVDSEKRLMGELVYNTDLFSDESAGRMKDRFLEFVKKLIQSPNNDIKNIELISEEEKQLLVNKWNNTSYPLPEGKTILHLMDEQVLRTPESIALKWESGSLSYGELWEKVQNFSSVMLGRGVKNGDRVAIMMDRSPEMIIAILSLMAMGAAYIPIDPDFPVERIKYIVKDASIKKIIKQKHLSIAEDFVETIDYCGTSTPSPSAKFLPIPADVAYVIYTSGTTGEPKGAAISHKNLLNDIWHITQRQISVKDLQLTLFSTNISFDQSIEEMFPSLCVGGTVLITDSPLDLWWRSEPVSLIVTTPSQMLYVLEDPLPATLNSLVLGGEVLSPSLVETIFKKTKVNKIFNSYGPTECTDQSTVCEITRENQEVNLGQPISNTQIYILNQEGNLVPQGVWGELCIGGEGVGLGYLNREELTKEKFINNPFSKGLLYKSGDIARWNFKGFLEITGRSDDQIKVHGIRIEKGEIQNTLLKFPGVESAFVNTHADNNGDEQLLAYVVPDTLDVRKIEEHCRCFLPAHLVPKQFILLKDIPLTKNGKVDSKQLPQKLCTITKNQVENEYTYDQDVLNQVLDLFRKVLKKPTLSADISFFSAGGHSLLVMQLLAQVRSLFGLKMKMRDFMDHSTAIALCSLIKAPKKNHLEDKKLDRSTDLGEYNEVDSGGSSILIIGAGIAGIMAAIECKKRGIPFQIVEKSDSFGGIWCQGCNEKSKLQTTSQVYSVDKSVAHEHVYPNRKQVLQYLRKIVENYDLHKDVIFQSEVRNVTSGADGFTVEVEEKSTQQKTFLKHSGILVCTGKHHVPHIPQWSITDGAPPIVHASKLDGVQLKDKEVVIVGCGSFGVEALRIAHEEGASKITLLARTSHWIVPTLADTILYSDIDHDTLTFPSSHDQLVDNLNSWMSDYYTQFGVEHFIPTHKTFDVSISTSDDFFKIIQKDGIELKVGEIDSVAKDTIALKDGGAIKTDVLIAATGYKDPQFPFLNTICNGSPTVYKGFMLSSDPRIGFVGFLDMFTSATAVIPLNLELSLRVMSDASYRPSVERVEQWIEEMPEDLISNVKSHLLWLQEEKEYLEKQSSKKCNPFSLNDWMHQFSDRIAFIENETSLTYKEVQKKSLEIAMMLTKKNCKTVLAMLPETSSSFICLLGILQRGCKVFLTGDNQDIGNLQLKENVDLIFLPKEAYKKNREKLDVIAPVFIIGEEAGVESSEVYRLDGECIFWSSGSTGSPKGIVHTQSSLDRALENFGLTIWNNAKEQPRLLFSNRISHLGGFMSSLTTLKKGGTVIFSSLVPENIAGEVKQYRPNLLVLLTSWASNLVQEPEVWKHLKHVVLGGEAICPDLEEELKKCPVSFTFGISECGPLFKREIQNSMPNQIGEPLPGVLYKVEKKEDSDTVGELLIKSSSLFKGYYGEAPHSGWFRTGDMVVAGEKPVYKGRKQDLIKGSTFVQDVENDLINDFGLTNIIVTPVGKRLYASLSYTENNHINLSDIESALSARFPGLTPIVQKEESFVRNFNGKINRYLFRQKYDRPKVLLFPGQGVQFPGMADHISDHPLFKQAEEILGYDLARVCSSSNQIELNRTDVCQPAIYAVSIIELQLALEKDSNFLSECQFALGLSLGEYSALTASGALSFVDGLKLLSLRGKLMQEASQHFPQAMCSIMGLDKAVVLDHINQYQQVYLATDLDEYHVVVAGDKQECDELVEWVDNQGGSPTLLQVSGAFHTPYMSSVSEALASAIKETPIKQPLFPVIANVDGDITYDPEEIKQKLIAQLDKPVQFEKSLMLLGEKKFSLEEMKEFGPKQTVLGIFKRFKDKQNLKRLINKPNKSYV